MTNDKLLDIHKIAVLRANALVLDLLAMRSKRYQPAFQLAS
ncbi:MAG TPA: hypothetical protein V6D11_03825 [Waterburya sp.]